MTEKKNDQSRPKFILGPDQEANPAKDKPTKVTLQPALRQIGITDCPICKHELAVFLTKTSRPFVNCSFCSARIFYNGVESMERLKRTMRPIKDRGNLVVIFWEPSGDLADEDRNATLARKP